MFNVIKEKIFSGDSFEQLKNAISKIEDGGRLQLKGIHGSLMAFVASCVFEIKQEQVFVIMPTKDDAEKLKDDCSVLMGDSAVHLYIHGPSHAEIVLDMNAPVSQIETMLAFSKNEKVIVSASAEALAVKLPQPELFLSSLLEVEVNGDYNFEALINKLIGMGFKRKDFVEGYGDIAVRGGILDVFPYVGDNPVRIEFWGDRIESIREFDVISQKSVRKLQKTILAPGFLISDSFIETDENKEFSYESSVFDYLSKSALVIFNEPALMEKEIKKLHDEGFKNIFSWEDILKMTEPFCKIVHSVFKSEQHRVNIDFGSLPQSKMNGSIKNLIKEIASANEQRYSLYIGCDGENAKERLNELIEEELTSPNTTEKHGEANIRTEDFWDSQFVNLNQKDQLSHEYKFLGCNLKYEMLPYTLHSGFVYPQAKVIFITEHEIFGRIKQRRSFARKRFRGITQKELTGLHYGDFVVHQDYGIGKFAGLQRIKVGNTETEVMKLIYDGNDVLYVNLNFINRVQKYSSREGYTPKLSKLSSQDWDRLKARARKKIKEIARDLIKLYAKRKLENGYAFSPDTHWQKEMEASFIYEDTPDQARTTIEVKRDMENPTPMDRLVCGDVGFGKTEIAVRAAFKAVMDNKQVAVLVPTTILAQQHYNTFIDRLSRYSVNIELLSRFKSRKSQNEILTMLKEGRIDILIGTHRMLSKDVNFKDLGLLIIDEEHRFGVEAKEKLRQLKVSVDTLTLTATPIPRTLQFSLMGARDLSLIATPPRNRLPIQTEIAQFDLDIIREAIIKELNRGGQVFFVHDRVQGLEQLKSMLEELIPEAKFGIAHGQMKSKDLEKAMMDFLERKYDVLVCTKIVEAGIDIPNVNTIIINRADKFGLAELYQLRGRVGRSNVQAFAYLLTPPFSVLPKDALKRLQAIQEFTELGSGFNLAIRDLEIRGAGNLLGKEQTGFILEMGYEMYERIVEEAIKELKEQEFEDQFKSELGKLKPKKKVETIIETNTEAYIPDYYIEQDSERFDFYRRLYKCENMEDLYMIKTELLDRFGQYPKEVENLLKAVEIKIIGSQIGLEKIILDHSNVVLCIPPVENSYYCNFDKSWLQNIITSVNRLENCFIKLDQQNGKLKISIDTSRNRSNNSILETARDLIAKISEDMGLNYKRFL